MRPLTCFIAMSQDGYIAGPSGEVDWLFTDQDYGYTPFSATVDAVVMGRKTYELCRRFPEYPYAHVANYVASRTPQAANAQVSFISEDLAAFLRALKRQPGKTIWVVGGSEVLGDVLVHDLLDELIVSVHPVTLGGGTPLFRAGLQIPPFSLVRSETFTSGLVQLTYRRSQPEAPLHA